MVIFNRICWVFSSIVFGAFAVLIIVSVIVGAATSEPEPVKHQYQGGLPISDFEKKQNARFGYEHYSALKGTGWTGVNDPRTERFISDWEKQMDEDYPNRKKYK